MKKHHCPEPGQDGGVHILSLDIFRYKLRSVSGSAGALVIIHIILIHMHLSDLCCLQRQPEQSCFREDA